MKRAEDPFAGLVLADLRRAGNLKWDRYPADVLPAWIADMDVGLCPAVGAALRDAIDTASTAGSLGYPSEELAAQVGREFRRRSKQRFAWDVDEAGVHLITDIVGGLTRVLDHVTVPGDGVILQTPAYPPFLEQVATTGRRVIAHRGDSSGGEWTWSPLDLERSIDDRTKVLVIVNPHNPTGRVFRREELEALGRIAARHDLVVVSDEIHADLTFGAARHIPFASIDRDTAARTVTLTSASKAFNLAGMRCVIAHHGSHPLLQGMGPPGPSSSALVSSLAMTAALAAWRHGDEWLDEVVAALAHRRAMLKLFLGDHLPSVGYIEGEATFLAWLDFGPVGLGDDPADFFLGRARVALGSGPTYGAQGVGFARLNLATSTSLLTEMLERMVTAIDLHHARRSGRM